MVEEDKLSWDDAINTGDFVKFESDKPMILTLVNSELVRNAADVKFKPGMIAFRADVTELNGLKVDKTLHVNSNRLLEKLRPFFEGKGPGPVKVSITKVGEEFNTQYSVQFVQ